MTSFTPEGRGQNVMEVEAILRRILTPNPALDAGRTKAAGTDTAD